MLPKLSNFIKERKQCFKLILVYSLANLIVAAVFYFILPIILNYPRDYVARNFQLTGVLYHHQYIIILSLAEIIGSVALLILLKDIDFQLISLADGSRKNKCLHSKYANLPLILYSMPIIGGIIIPLLFFMALKIPAIHNYKNIIVNFCSYNFGS